MKRREFLSMTVSCSSHMAALAAFAPSLMKSIFHSQQREGKSKVVTQEKWGSLEQVAERTWVLISTPFETQDFTTVCNGGIIAGDDRVLAIESFMQPQGAVWLAKQAQKLTGKWPTDVVSTHYHADHTAGHLGYITEKHSPKFWLTEPTQKAAESSFIERKIDNNSFRNVKRIETAKPTEVDLGNRKVRFVNRSGHTQSDVTIEVNDPKVVWCGDLFFNRVFPNYGDATPSRLSQFVEVMRGYKNSIIVPGHGPIADQNAVEKYKRFLGHIEKSARKAFSEKTNVEEVTKDFKLPAELSDWLIWSPDNAKRAFAAWFRELEP